MSPADAPAERWTILPLLKTTAEYFAGKGVDSPRLDAELLLAAALGVQRIELYTQYDRELSDAELARYRALVGRRGRREPVAYLVGGREFYGLEFRVTPAVLVPRPESETLVEEALRFLRARPAPLRLLDVGTGSGCLAVSLLQACPGARAVATDISAEALAVAAENARRHGVEERLELRRGSLYEPAGGEVFDLVVCNPPYVDPQAPDLMPEVRDYEPREALYAEEQGRALYRPLAAGLGAVLAADGLGLFELGAGQAEFVAERFAAAGFAHVDAVPDMSGRPRALRAARRPLAAAAAVTEPPAEYTYEPIAEPRPLLEDPSPAAGPPAMEEPPAPAPGAELTYEPLSRTPAEEAALRRLLDEYAEGGDEEAAAGGDEEADAPPPEV